MKSPEDDPQPEAGPGNGEDRVPADEPKGLVPSEPAAAEAAGEELERVKRERDELREQLLRRRAEFENYRKRVERDRHQASLDAEVALIKALIPTLDNLERALSAQAAEPGPLREGVELTLRELSATLEAAGVCIQDPVGEPFDPRRHQALSHEVVPGQPEGIVVEVFRKGYFLKDRLLRPALVKVAKAAPSQGETGDADDGAQTVH